MSILRLKKASLIGLTADKLQTLDALQQLGLMHVIPLQEITSRTQAEEIVNPELLKRTLQHLLNCSRKRRQVTQREIFDLHQVLREVDYNRSERIRLTEQRDFLQQRISDLEPWGDFHFPEPEALNHQKLWFYLLPNYRMRELAATPLPWVRVHQDNRNSYVVVIAEQEPEPNLLPVARTHTGDQPLSQLQARLEATEIALEACEAEREAQTRWIYLLQQSVAHTEDAALLAEVLDKTRDYDPMFAMQGWVASRDVERLQAFADQQGLVLLVEEPAEDERPPTYLENSDLLGGGQEIVNFFQLPNYRSWDPSRVIFFSFATFFAIIMSDAAYSLCLGLLLLPFWQRMGASQSGRRLRAMGMALAGGGIVWGVMVGSYFGLEPPPLLAPLKILDLNDFNGMMRLSIIIGALHLIIANLMMAWIRRSSLNALASVGWALAVVVGLLGWLYAFTPLHWGLFILGLLLVLLFSGQEQSFQLKGLLPGFKALTDVTKLFGDVLSYLRLFALGLASASLAITFNGLASDAGAAVPGVGLLLQLLILLIGHLMNFALTVVSGVIHGLRLNLIEFYNWSLADEGYPFQPFAKREITPWTT